jgi:hypothetical protein
MTLTVEFDLDLFHGEEDWSDSAAAVKDLLTASVKINQRYLRAHPECPSPFAKDENGRYLLRYLNAHANAPREKFRSIPAILAAGGSDCDGIVAFVVAWRREREGDAKADVALQWRRGLQPGTLRFHVLEKRGSDGALGDPCRTLGM